MTVLSRDSETLLCFFSCETQFYFVMQNVEFEMKNEALLTLPNNLTTKRTINKPVRHERESHLSKIDDNRLLQESRVFVRDGFIDRYTGQQLLYPGALLLLQQLRPEFLQRMQEQPDQRTSCTKQDELMPKVDRIVPLHLGGRDDDQNWITTSVRRYIMRGIHTPEKLGWEVHPPGSLRKWDGLMEWFLQMMESNTNRAIDRSDAQLQKWYRVGRDGKWVY